MMKSAIHIESISKEYHIGLSRRGGYRTLRESVMEGANRIWRGIRRTARPSSAADEAQENRARTFWALRDVSFEVHPGEVVAIIGRNGAGKSTLLKILSRIVEPTTGTARLRGRIGGLLEVGTGFHPELTGRENIFLSGTVLGMSRREIARKFDEIVAFAEIESFLDTPVKRYSSGMYVRLGFAVAAHLEPEILVVDEVLAVGDAAFQKKCLDKMRHVGRDGRTVLFVSHNLSILNTLCNRGVVLQQGKLVYDATIADAVSHYLASIEKNAAIHLIERSDRTGNGLTRLTKIEIHGGNSETGSLLTMGQLAQIHFHVSALVPGMFCVFSVHDQYGHPITRFNSGFGSLEDSHDAESAKEFVCSMDELLLAPGRYRLDVSLRANGEMLDHVEAAAFFEVVRGTIRGRQAPHFEGDWKFCLPHRWKSPQ